MPGSKRSCVRCIGKKRKCDHGVPECSLCRKAGAACSYPPDQQRRGPIAGASKIIEARVSELERAIAFVLGMSEVRQGLQTAIANGWTELPNASLLDGMDQETKLQWFEARPLLTVQDLLDYKVTPQQSVTAELPMFPPQHARHSRQEHTLRPDGRTNAESDRYDVLPLVTGSSLTPCTGEVRDGCQNVSGTTAQEHWLPREGDREDICTPDLHPMSYIAPGDSYPESTLPERWDEVSHTAINVRVSTPPGPRAFLTEYLPGPAVELGIPDRPGAGPTLMSAPTDLFW